MNKLLATLEEMENEIKNESELVWLIPPERFTYLREGTAATMKSKGVPVPKKTFPIIVGYANHKRIIAPKGAYSTYVRRFWFLKEYDRDIEPDGCYKDTAPCEAVIPTRIKIRERSASFIWRLDN